MTITSGSASIDEGGAPTSSAGSVWALPLIVPIRAYQRWISPALPARCRYAPTCSAYAIESLRVHGPIKGLVLAMWRLLRCNPWSLGGVDHVPPKGRWRPAEWIPPKDWAGNDPTIEHPLPMGLDPAHASQPTHEGGIALVNEDHPAAAGRNAGAPGVPTT